MDPHAERDLDAFATGEKLELYRRRRGGLPISDEHERHFAGLSPQKLEALEEMARQHDEQDKRVRDEIARYPDGYGWHKSVGGGLPFDWCDSELTHLRPRDWKQARQTFVRTGRRSVPKQRQPRARSREHRPRVARRTSSSSTTSGSDPGGDGPGEPPPPAERRWPA